VVRVTAAELKARLDRGEAIAVLDVREPVERDYCAIRLPATARDLFIPMGELPVRLEEVRGVTGASLVVVYCHLGVRSRRAAEWLAHHGMSGLANLEGGIDAWSADVDPDVPRY
jgi:rhodanese-related sulfurtransferase